MPDKLDPRVVRTRRMLSEAFVVLILDKGYDAVTIQDITDAAGLRRATFYLHYKDKEELLFAMLRQAFDQLVERLSSMDQLDPLSHELDYESNRHIFRLVEENADLYRAILSGRGAAVITRYIRGYMADVIRLRLTPEIEAGITNVPVDVLANFITGVKLSMVMWWLENDMPYEVDTIARMCTDLSVNGYVGLYQPEG
jgi:AcrR family transcriptional regulator